MIQPDTAPSGDQDRITDSAATAILDVLLPLCDDLPGEPPALLAWSPDVLAQRLAEGLAANGWTVRHD